MPTAGPFKLKVMLFCGQHTAIGPGKADLLEAIEQGGSITAAARAMGMSYRRAWTLVATMNRSWTKPLVETSMGGGGRGGASLTAFGKHLLTGYRALESDLMRYAATSPFSAWADDLLNEPRPQETQDHRRKSAADLAVPARPKALQSGSQ